MTTIEVARRGQITIPKSLRDNLHIEEGQKYDVRTLEGGIIILTPKQGGASAVLSKLKQALLSKGASLEEMLAELRQKRETDAE